MIVVDSSVIVAILSNETEAVLFEDILLQSRATMMSAVNAYETAIIVRRKAGDSDRDLVWQFLAKYGIGVVPFDETQAHAAAAAYDRYGKGIDPRARLNLADCAAYALAMTFDVPLLFKGSDFSATDVRVAAP